MLGGLKQVFHSRNHIKDTVLRTFLIFRIFHPFHARDLDLPGRDMWSFRPVAWGESRFLDIRLILNAYGPVSSMQTRSGKDLAEIATHVGSRALA